MRQLVIYKYQGDWIEYARFVISGNMVSLQAIATCEILQELGYKFNVEEVNA